MVLLDAPSIFMNSSVGKYRKYMRKILPENTTLKLDLLSPWLICQLFCIWGETRKCAKTGYGIFVKKWVWKCLESATWHLPAGLACNHYLPAWRRDRCWRPAGTFRVAAAVEEQRSDASSGGHPCWESVLKGSFSPRSLYISSHPGILVECRLLCSPSSRGFRTPVLQAEFWVSVASSQGWHEGGSGCLTQPRQASDSGVPGTRRTCGQVGGEEVQGTLVEQKSREQKEKQADEKRT